MGTENICTSETLILNGPNGNLNVIVQKPEIIIGKKYPCVILMHGLLKDSQVPILVDMAKALVKEGFITVRFDFDGCGKSEGDFEDMTIGKEIEDARAVYDYCKLMTYVSDISLLGHSQGAVIAGILAGDMGVNKVKSLILLSAAVIVEGQAKEGFVLGVKFDPENIPEYINIGEKKLGKAFLKEAQGLNIFMKMSEYTGPVCIIHGRMDQVVKYTYSEELQKMYKDCELYLLDNEDHGYTENPNLPVDIVVKFMDKNKVKV